MEVLDSGKSIRGSFNGLYLSSAGVESIAKQLTKHQSPAVKSLLLDLSLNSLNTADIVKVIESLEGYQLQSLQLRLSHNYFGIEGITSLSRLLFK